MEMNTQFFKTYSGVWYQMFVEHESQKSGIILRVRMVF